MTEFSFKRNADAFLENWGGRSKAYLLKNWRALAFFSASLGLAFYVLQSWIGIGINISVSLSPGSYIVGRWDKSAEYDNFVVFRYAGDAALFPHGTRVCKRVAGVAGDKVYFNKETNNVEIKRAVSIESMTGMDQRPEGSDKTIIIGGNTVKVTRKDLIAKGFKPELETGSFTIPEGYFFAVGDSPVSFDSRYKQMGLIQTKSIEGRAWQFYNLKTGKFEWPHSS